MILTLTLTCSGNVVVLLHAEARKAGDRVPPPGREVAQSEISLFKDLNDQHQYSEKNQ